MRPAVPAGSVAAKPCLHRRGYFQKSALLAAIREQLLAIWLTGRAKAAAVQRRSAHTVGGCGTAPHGTRPGRWKRSENSVRLVRASSCAKALVALGALVARCRFSLGVNLQAFVQRRVGKKRGLPRAALAPFLSGFGASGRPHANYKSCGDDDTDQQQSGVDRADAIYSAERRRR